MSIALPGLVMPGIFHLAVARAPLAVLAGLAAACGETMGTEVDMNRDLDRVFEQALALDRELEVHAAGVLATAKTGDASAREEGHRDSMSPHMSELDHVLADMATYCRHRESRQGGRTDDMEAAMSLMRDEFERHRRASRPDALAVRSEEDRHLRESRELLSRLRDAGSAMRHEAGYYRCEHGMH